jgi:hypothetical protein
VRSSVVSSLLGLLRARACSAAAVSQSSQRRARARLLRMRLAVFRVVGEIDVRKRTHSSRVGCASPADPGERYHAVQSTVHLLPWVSLRGR